MLSMHEVACTFVVLVKVHGCPYYTPEMCESIFQTCSIGPLLQRPLLSNKS